MPTKINNKLYVKFKLDKEKTVYYITLTDLVKLRDKKIILEENELE